MSKTGDWFISVMNCEEEEAGGVGLGCEPENGSLTSPTFRKGMTPAGLSPVSAPSEDHRTDRTEKPKWDEYI